MHLESLQAKCATLLQETEHLSQENIQLGQSLEHLGGRTESVEPAVESGRQEWRVTYDELISEEEGRPAAPQQVGCWGI